MYAVQNSKKLYLLVKGSELNSQNNFYIDTDNNGDTGYHLWCWNNSGADYMIEENMIKKYVGNGDDWNWVQVGTAELVKNSSIIEVSAELSSLELNEPTEIKVGYSRNYSDFAPVTGNKMAQANGIILDDEELLAKLIYLTSPLESSKNLTARVIVDGGDIDTSRNYYTEAFCSWDNNLV